MASFVRNNPLNTEVFRADEPLNFSFPIRIALLGGAKTGKTSLISKLIQGIFTDTYYPTVRTNSDLFTFTPESEDSRVILGTTSSLSKIETESVLLSPVLRRLKRNYLKRSQPVLDELGSEVLIHQKTEYYKSYNYKSDESDEPPRITPMLVEIIDTPAYKSDFIPFLESSLYTNLDKNILKNLANEPRRHVLTMPLLVASGAGELNGSLHGYFYVYSAIPSYEPPSYELGEAAKEDSLSEIQKIKSSIDEAWKEFYTYKMRWEEGKEADIYSVKTALKNFLTSKNVEEEELKRFSKRKYYKELLEYPRDPADPYCPPPIWIICTHAKSPLASSKLVEDGRKTAIEWGCGFMNMDITDGDVDVVLALMIRETAERMKLRRQREVSRAERPT